MSCDQVDKEEIEYVPAPPPKTNPWKKPVVDQAAVPEKSSKPSSDAKTIETAVVTEKLKAEKAPKVKAGESKQQQVVSKSNPWKKLEKSSKAVDEEVAGGGGGGEAGGEDGAERRGEKGSSTWPTLALKPSKKKKEGEEAPSVEEGKENQVGQLFLNLFTCDLLFPLSRTVQTSTTTTTSRVTTT